LWNPPKSGINNWYKIHSFIPKIDGCAVKMEVNKLKW